MKKTDLEELWSAGQPGNVRFEPAIIARYPEPVRRYLSHAIEPGALLASAVRISMHGQIKLGTWHDFAAEEVIRWGQGMIWQASVHMFGMTVRGSDSIVGGRGRMEWRLFGLLPFIDASGPDITRSTAGRTNIESVWLPSVLCREDIEWTTRDATLIRASFQANGYPADIDIQIDERGGVDAIVMNRWGNPERKTFHEAPFGGFSEEDASFHGYTVPKRMRIGWYPQNRDFAQGGEFFRVTVDSAEYR